MSHDTKNQVTRENFKHFTRIGTRWGDCDKIGHVNNVEFARYIESARVDYFSDVFELDQLPTAADAFVVADSRLTYLQQLHHPSQVEIGTKTSRVGNSSFDLFSAMFIEGDDSPIALSTVVCVWFDFQSDSSKPIPDWARQCIVNFENLAS